MYLFVHRTGKFTSSIALYPSLGKNRVERFWGFKYGGIKKKPTRESAGPVSRVSS